MPKRKVCKDVAVRTTVLLFDFFVELLHCGSGVLLVAQSTTAARAPPPSNSDLIQTHSLIHMLAVHTIPHNLLRIPFLALLLISVKGLLENMPTCLIWRPLVSTNEDPRRNSFKHLWTLVQCKAMCFFSKASFSSKKEYIHMSKSYSSVDVGVIKPYDARSCWTMSSICLFWKCIHYTLPSSLIACADALKTLWCGPFDRIRMFLPEIIHI